MFFYKLPLWTLTVREMTRAWKVCKDLKYSLTCLKFWKFEILQHFKKELLESSFYKHIFTETVCIVVILKICLCKKKQKKNYKTYPTKKKNSSHVYYSSLNYKIKLYSESHYRYWHRKKKINMKHSLL